MPKFKVTVTRIKDNGLLGPPRKAIVEADNYFDAQRIAKEQFDDHRITHVTEIKEKAPPRQASRPSRRDAEDRGASGGESESGSVVGGAIVIGAIVLFMMGRCSADTDRNSPRPAAVVAPLDTVEPMVVETPTPADIEPEALGPDSEAYVEQPGEAEPFDVIAEQPEVAPTPPALLTYYALVRSPGGEAITTEVQAPSEERAREIIRDFRGNPEVLEGPATEQTW